MPEIGERVRVYFPSDHEEESFVFASIREGNSNGGKIDQPGVKRFRNKYGKEIMLTEKTVTFLVEKKVGEKKVKDSKGKEQIETTMKTFASLTLDEDNGVKLVAENEINFSADGNINLNAGKTVQMNVGRGKMVLMSNGSTVFMDKIGTVTGEPKIEKLIVPPISAANKNVKVNANSTGNTVAQNPKKNTASATPKKDENKEKKSEPGEGEVTKASLKWNNIKGGVDLSYTVTKGNLKKDTIIEVYWSKSIEYKGHLPFIILNKK